MSGMRAYDDQGRITEQEQINDVINRVNNATGGCRMTFKKTTGMKKLMNLYDDLNWEDADGYSDGTKRKVLRNEDGGRTILLKLPAGFYMAPHSHLTTEQHFVLKGEYTSQGESYPEGSYQIFSAGDEHGPFESKNGALILVIWDPLKTDK